MQIRREAAETMPDAPNQQTGKSPQNANPTQAVGSKSPDPAWTSNSPRKKILVTKLLRALHSKKRVEHSLEKRESFATFKKRVE